MVLLADSDGPDQTASIHRLIWAFAVLICPKTHMAWPKQKCVWVNLLINIYKYRIRPNYRTYPYKRSVKQFRSLQITASVLFVYFFIKAYVVGTHVNCIDLSMQFKWVPTIYVLIKKIRKKSHKHHLIRPLLVFVLMVSLVGRVCFTTSFPSNFEKPKRTVR